MSAPQARAVRHEANEHRRARLTRLARFLDSGIRLPGGFRIGVDGLIGLVPVVGDVAGGAWSAYIVLSAAKLGVPRAVLARMALNVAIEVVVGSIPVVGDIFDFVFKANQRNMRLVDDALDDVASAKQAIQSYENH